MARHPDAYIRVFLFRAAEPRRYEMARRDLDNRGRMAGRIRRCLVNEFGARDGRVSTRRLLGRATGESTQGNGEGKESHGDGSYYFARAFFTR